MGRQVNLSQCITNFMCQLGSLFLVQREEVGFSEKKGISSIFNTTNYLFSMNLKN